MAGPEVRLARAGKSGQLGKTPFVGRHHVALKRRRPLGPARAPHAPKCKRRARIGIVTTIGGAAVFTFAVAMRGPEHLSWPLYLGLMLPALAVAAGLALTSRSPRYRDDRLSVFYVWVFAVIILISASVALTGGGRSNLYLLYVGPLLFGASFFPVPAQLVLATCSAAGYLAAVASNNWDLSTSTLLVRATTLALIAAISNSLTAEAERTTAESARRATLLATVAEAARDLNVLDTDKVFDSVMTSMSQAQSSTRGPNRRSTPASSAALARRGQQWH